MAGFKYKKFSFTGGSAEFPSGTSASDIQTKERAIVKGFADALIAMNIGWGCDTTRNATTSDFVDVPKYSSSTPAPGLFLVNATSGCKLFIAYVDDPAGMALYDSDGTTKLLPTTSSDNFVSWFNSSSTYTNVYCVGFIMSMIPAGSSNTFGPTFKAYEFLPTDATRLYSSAIRISSSISNSPKLASRINNGETHTICVWGNPYCVGYGNGRGSQTNNNFCYCAGRIIGELGNATADNSNQSKYGILPLTQTITDANEYDITSSSPYRYNMITLQTTPLNGNEYVFGKIPISVSFALTPSNGTSYPNWGYSICKADGTWIQGTSTHFVTPVCWVYKFKNPHVQDLTSNNRMWAPIEMWLYASDPQNDYIANGNGFKGYLDTDLFRCSPQFAEGTVMDNGNFVCTGVGCLTLGWDPSNESW